MPNESGYLNSIALTVVAMIAVALIGMMALVALPLAAEEVIVPMQNASAATAPPLATGQVVVANASVENVNTEQSEDDLAVDEATELTNATEAVPTTATSVALANGSVSTVCASSADCIIVDGSDDYTQCYAGYCDERAYWEDAYVAVNVEAFFMHVGGIPPPASCGPEPECTGTLQPMERSVLPQCVAGVCQKVEND